MTTHVRHGFPARAMWSITVPVLPTNSRATPEHRCRGERPYITQEAAFFAIERGYLLMARTSGESLKPVSRCGGDAGKAKLKASLPNLFPGRLMVGQRPLEP